MKSGVSALIFAIGLLASASFAFPPERDDPKRIVVLDALRAARRSEISRIEKEIAAIPKRIEQAKKDLKNLKRDKNYRKKSDGLKMLIDSLDASEAKYREQIDRIESGKEEVSLMPLQFGELGVGDVGSITGGELWRIADVRSDTEFVGVPDVSYFDAGSLVKRTKDGSMPYAVRGRSTAKMVDGQRIELTGMFWVAEKMKWKGRTIFVLEAFNSADYVDEKD